ncbi:MAG TPA: peptide methionine sulfoxide reductase [Microlunatus sp.]|nr:peptide methionine sulfoxide reductase [Microlunatus sp.]
MTGSNPDPTGDDHDLGPAVDALPEGWSRVLYRGRPYGLTKITHGDGRSLSVYAEQLGGSEVISANVYRTTSGDLLKPCEMPAATVLAFLRGAQPVGGDLPS